MVDLTEFFGPEGFSVFDFTRETAEKQYTESQYELLEMLIVALKEAEFRHDKERAFLISALQSMLDGKCGDAAFLQKGSVSGKRNTSFEKIKTEMEIAACVLFFRYPKKLKTLDKSYEEAAKRFNISKAKAKKLYLEHKAFLEDQLDTQKNS